MKRLDVRVKELLLDKLKIPIAGLGDEFDNSTYRMPAYLIEFYANSSDSILEKINNFEFQPNVSAISIFSSAAILNEQWCFLRVYANCVKN
jgi:hypothetical protein